MLGRVTEGGVPSSLCHFDAAAALRGLMPAGQDFEALHAAASAVLSSGGVEPESRVRLGRDPPAAACACQQAYLFSERVNMQGSPAPHGNAIRVMVCLPMLAGCLVQLFGFAPVSCPLTHNTVQQTMECACPAAASRCAARV